MTISSGSWRLTLACVALLPLLGCGGDDGPISAANSKYQVDDTSDSGDEQAERRETDHDSSFFRAAPSGAATQYGHNSESMVSRAIASVRDATRIAIFACSPMLRSWPSP